MAISTVTNRVAYQGNGTSATFAFAYQFQRQSDLGVFIFNSTLALASMIQAKVLNTDYTISGTADAQGIYQSGGNVVFNSTPNAQAQIVIFRSSIVTNSFYQAQNGPISASGLNQEFDYLTIIAQRLQDQATRAVRLPDGLPGTFDPTIPANVFSQRNKTLVINSSGTGFTLANIGSTGGYIQNTMLYSQDGTAINSLPGAADGAFLMSHGSSAPTWATVNLGSSSQFTGLLTFDHGGTGSNQNFIANGIVYGSSTTDLACTAAGGVDVPLIGNGATTPPSFKPLNIASNSSVTGILAVSHGGLGNATFQPATVLYATTAALVISLPVGASGTVLTSQGSSAPTWTSALTNPLTTLGDIVVSGIAGAANRIGVGTDRQILTSNSSATFGIQWQTTTAPSVQRFTVVGSSTYTTPTSPPPRYINVFLVGAGGGGGGDSGNGAAGGNTYFGGSSFLSANGGGLGAAGGAAGGAGGTTFVASGVIIVANYSGGGGGGSINAVSGPGGMGGSSPFGGAGRSGSNNAAGLAGVANTGSGGGGSGSNAGGSSGGGGAGGYINGIIISPSATYTVSIPAGGTLGSGTPAGGAGASGVVIVEEYYS